MAWNDWSSSPYYDQAVAAAQKYNVPVPLFVQQIGAESSFNPLAKNPNSSAAGIAQFINATAREYGVNQYDPVSSLEGAARYMRDLYNRKGSWEGALNAYGTTHGGNNPNLASAARAIDSASSGLGGTIKSAIDAVDPLQMLDKASGGIFSSNEALGQAVGLPDLAAVINIITDLPRMITIIMGLILLTAGLFILGARPAVQIVDAMKNPLKAATG